MAYQNEWHKVWRRRLHGSASWARLPAGMRGMAIKGVYHELMCFVDNDPKSPWRGYLFSDLLNGVPATTADIAQWLGLRRPAFEKTLSVLIDVGLVAIDEEIEAFYLPRFGRLQSSPQIERDYTAPKKRSTNSSYETGTGDKLKLRNRNGTLTQVSKPERKTNSSLSRVTKPERKTKSPNINNLQHSPARARTCAKIEIKKENKNKKGSHLVGGSRHMPKREQKTTDPKQAVIRPSKKEKQTPQPPPADLDDLDSQIAETVRELREQAKQAAERREKSRNPDVQKKARAKREAVQRENDREAATVWEDETGEVHQYEPPIEIGDMIAQGMFGKKGGGPRGKTQKRKR